uniref:Uncharacterized protein n=1 Tax=Romanomermis culicivorax TaxID=13658 RepID=A0A915HRZ4_ROMCU
MIRKRQVRCLRDEVLKSTMSRNRAENATGVITDANDLMISSSDPLTAISSLRDQNSSFKHSLRRVRRDFGAEIDQTNNDSGSICSSEPIIANPPDQRPNDDTRANSVIQIQDHCQSFDSYLRRGLSSLNEHGAVQAVLLPKKCQPTLSTIKDDSSNSLPKFVLRVKRRSLFTSLFNAHSAQSLPGGGSRKNSADGATFKIAPDAVRHAGLRRPFHQSLSGLADQERQQTAARGSKDKSAKNELYFGAPDKTNAEVISLSSLSSTSSSDDEAGHGDADEPKTGFIALSMMTLPCLAVRAMAVDLQDDTESAKSRLTTESSGIQNHLSGQISAE